MSGMASGPNALIAVGSGLLGLGVGASVSPALFIAGFSLRSEEIQRVFALIELLRGVAAFMVAPIVLHLAETVGSTPQSGIGVAVWVCFGIAAFGGLTAAYLRRSPARRCDHRDWSAGSTGRGRHSSRRRLRTRYEARD